MSLIYSKMRYVSNEKNGNDFILFMVQCYLNTFSDCLKQIYCRCLIIKMHLFVLKYNAQCSVTVQ